MDRPPLGTSAQIRRRKQELRARMRAVRREMPVEEREARSAQAVSRLFDLPEMARAGTVLVFYSFGSEISTREAAHRLLASGRRVLLPYLEDGAMHAGQPRPGAELTPTGYGPKEPAERVAIDPAEIDVVVTPGLAFDRRGHRLGYGGGYYDRYLARLGGRPYRVGVGFREQLVEEVPAGPGDERVDAVVTDQETVTCDRSAGGE
jgi:5-formyltetrahydrofolate cyclo-ligase